MRRLPVLPWPRRWALEWIKFGLPLPFAHAARIFLTTAVTAVALAVLYPGFVALGTSHLRALRLAAR